MRFLSFIIVATASDLILFNRYANTVHQHVNERLSDFTASPMKLQLILRGLKEGFLEMAKQLIDHDDHESVKSNPYRLSYYLS